MSNFLTKTFRWLNEAPPPAPVAQSQSQSQLDTPPKWAKELLSELRRVAQAIPGEVDQQTRRMEEELQSVRGLVNLQNKEFDALRSFVQTGRSCSDCNATRRGMIAHLREVLTEVDKRPQYSSFPGEGYVTKSDAFRAGWSLCVSHLKNAVQSMEDSL